MIAEKNNGNDIIPLNNSEENKNADKEKSKKDNNEKGKKNSISSGAKTTSKAFNGDCGKDN